MDEARRNTWAVLGTGLLAAGLVIVIGFAGRENRAWWFEWLLIAGLVLIGIALLILVWVVPGLLRRQISHIAGVRDGEGGTKVLALTRSDGVNVGYALARVFYKRKPVGESEPMKSGVSVTYQYPNEFKGALVRPLPLGKYRVVWYVSLLGDRLLVRHSKFKKVKKSKFRVSLADRDAAERSLRRGTFVASNEPGPGGRVRLKLRRYEAPIGWAKGEVRRRLLDGSLGESYAGYLDKPDAAEADLLFPDDFSRRLAEVRRLEPSGVRISDEEIELPSGEAGEYEVTWKTVGYVQGGAFALDHEVTMDDFRRESEVARDRFTIVAAGEPPIRRDQP